MKRIFYIVLVSLISCSSPVRQDWNPSQVNSERSDSNTQERNQTERYQKPASLDRMGRIASKGGPKKTLKDFEKKIGQPLSKVPKQVGDQIGEIERVKKLIVEKKFGDAFLYAKSLERSSNRQIRARAAFLKGEILFQQGEYDLAMQLLEDMIGKYAFSGMTLVALKRLIVCAEKLSLMKKRKKYHSILHDFFEAI